MIVTRLRLVYLTAVLVAVHNLEEALTFQYSLPLIEMRLPPALRPWIEEGSRGAIYAALAIATVIPWMCAFWWAHRPSNVLATWLVLLVQTIVFVNAFWHLLVASVLLGGYAPGLVTAVLVNMPFSIYLLLRVVRERWVSRASLLALLPAALLVHGAAPIALFYFGR